MDKEINKIITKLEGCFGIFDYVLTPIESNLLVSYIKELQQQVKKQKEVINKAVEYIKEKARNNCWIDQYESCDLIKILKEVSK